MARNYSNVAEETTLATSINSSDTSITVGSNTGYPPVPYTIIIDPGLPTEEVAEVTAVAGTMWTITRGVDGTPASSHDLGGVVVHGYSARDLRDIQDHIGDSSGVHGIAPASAVVGTTDTQTLANKTLTAPTINGGVLNSVTLGSGLTLQSPTLITPTIASFVNAQHDHSDAASGGLVKGGGGGGGLAYRRSSNESENVDITSAGDAGAVALRFDTLDYNVGGNATWAANGAGSRITLPTDIANGVWRVTANAEVFVSSEFDMPFLSVVHQDLGVVAASGLTNNLGGSVVGRRISVSAEFRSVTAGRWIEVRLGSDDASPIEFQSDARSVAISRVA